LHHGLAYFGFDLVLPTGMFNKGDLRHVFRAPLISSRQVRHDSTSVSSRRYSQCSI
jgi:hypothetical protein